MSTPRVALVAIGLGRVRRGFERYFEELHDAMCDTMDMELYRSAAPRDARERVPAFLRPATAIVRRLPLGGLAGGTEYNRDCLAFALTLLPTLLAGRHDIVHCIDPPLGFALSHMRRRLRFRTRILFTEGCVMPPEYFPPADHIHHVAEVQYRRALAAGIPAAQQTLVPCGFNAAGFGPAPDRAALRARHGIAPTTLLVLAISAVKRDHKRVHHLIDELAHVDGDLMLWIDGNPEDAALVSYAHQRLRGRCRITHVTSAEVRELYQIADVLAHAALEESFGLAIVEAMATGTPVLVHDTPHFAWLVEDRDCLVDMRAHGALAAHIAARLAGQRESAATLRGRAERACARFDWAGLAPAYRAMYDRVGGNVAQQRLLPA